MKLLLRLLRGIDSIVHMFKHEASEWKALGANWIKSCSMSHAPYCISCFVLCVLWPSFMTHHYSDIYFYATCLHIVHLKLSHHIIYTISPYWTLLHRFPDVALQWFQALLTDCDAARHGVDLFGRDSLLLGRLLATLGRFVVAAAPAPVTAHLASATIELLRTQQVPEYSCTLSPANPCSSTIHSNLWACDLTMCPTLDFECSMSCSDWR